jgi:hypothetical protein
MTESDPQEMSIILNVLEFLSARYIFKSIHRPPVTCGVIDPWAVDGTFPADRYNTDCIG